MFPLPTCPFRSTPKTILSSFYTLSINPSKVFPKIIFLLHAVVNLYSIGHKEDIGNRDREAIVVEHRDDIVVVVLKGIHSRSDKQDWN